MGQRHQIYVAVPTKGKKFEILGFHHQWLYGHTAVTQAARMMEFLSKSEYTPFKRGHYEFSREGMIEIIKAIYSVIPEDGYYHNIHELYQETCKNPLYGDNNDGITVIDARDNESPGYCFVNIDHLECDEVATQPEKLIPLSGEDYLRLYYPYWDYVLENQELPKKKRLPYWLKDVVVSEAVEVAEFIAQKNARISVFGGKVLTLDVLQELFPAMYEKDAVTS